MRWTSSLSRYQTTQLSVPQAELTGYDADTTPIVLTWEGEELTISEYVVACEPWKSDMRVRYENEAGELLGETVVTVSYGEHITAEPPAGYSLADGEPEEIIPNWAVNGRAVSDEIVQMHGGELTLENALSGGTLVTVRLPASQ